MPKTSLFLLVFLCFLIRAFCAFLLPLGNDEVYYILYARYPDIHYYDHPLLIGWAIKLLSVNLSFQQAFFYRLPALLLSVPSTILVYRTAVILKDEMAGWIAAVLFSGSLYTSIIAGMFAMPDCLMQFFWVSAIYISIKICIVKANTPKEINLLLLLFGLLAGLAILSKLHAFFLWVGLIGFALFYKRGLFKKWGLYAGLFLTALSSLPILIWNKNNDWVHFKFYQGRVGVESKIHFDYLLRELLGEIGYQGPIVFFFILLFGILSKSLEFKNKEKTFLLWMSLPLIIFIWLLSFFKETLPHWTGPAFIPLMILAAISVNTEKKIRQSRIWLRAASIFSFSVVVLGLLFILYFPGTIGSKKNLTSYGDGDFTLDMYGWNNSGTEIASYLKKERLDGLPVFSEQWFPAAHIDEYITQKSGNKLYAVGDLDQIHQYFWINQRRGGLPLSDSALVIVPSNYFRDPAIGFMNSFKSIQLIKQIPQFRGGKPTRYFHIYLLSQRKKKPS